MIAPGDVLHSRYRIERSIGRGGMGEVFSAIVLPSVPEGEHDLAVTLPIEDEDPVRVAIKVVSRAVVMEASMARLQREAEAAVRIKSPFVPELIDVGTTSEGEVFLAMEILYGETLAARLKSWMVLPWEVVYLLGDDVLSGLVDAHDAGVVHRDLKPSNIFICERTPPDNLERARILDFGVCKLDTPDQEKLTGTGESVGTVSYMAPEQIRGASHVTERADLYSFATVVFEALSGDLPHNGVGQMAVLASKLERPARRIVDVAKAAIPEGLDALLGRLLARDAAERFASAREVRDAWRALGPAVVAPRGSSGEVADRGPHATETALATGTVEVPRPGTSRVGIAMAAFSVVVSLVALLVLMAMRAQPARPEFTAAPDPEVTTGVVERPGDPIGPAAGATDLDAGSLVGDTTEPAVSKPTAPRPPRIWGQPRGRSSTTTPHIADKPRY